ncbi:hypothetical protein IL992_32265 [Microbispora sp. NEAU-D428]|uniref:hypothetical protein n=1 Tax=Microbispora sitophila TaxID=2771537 RepID=UPI001867D70B|nr:hypothetical protein [Microbispora sitophila]MBE3013824.1 hypothetical protein [Microbispora sitophila]
MNRKALAAAVSAVLALTLAPAAPAAAAPVVQIVAGYSASMREKDSKFFCPAGEVITGRAHDGDENGWTTYWCGRIYINGVQVSVSASPYADPRKEPYSWFEAPESNGMVGRRHDGDENGVTTTYFALLTWQGKPVQLINRRWTSRYRESGHESKAGAGEIMTGRKHYDDENGDSYYQYATVSF